MKVSFPIRLLLLAAAPLAAQQPLHSTAAIPATAPTATPASLQAVPRASALQAPARARVTLASGLITVSAANSSLNQILAEISRLTSLHISGGVNDERVFGTYGPAPLPDILSSLLDGTGSNFLLTDATPEKPAELILTARNGAPTPPSPPVLATNNPLDDDSSIRPASDASENKPDAPSAPSSAGPAGATGPAGAAGAAGPAGTAGPAESPQQQPSAQPNQQQSSPNGVKTPQDIYKELMERMQQQKQSQPQQ